MWCNFIQLMSMPEKPTMTATKATQDRHKGVATRGTEKAEISDMLLFLFGVDACDRQSWSRNTFLRQNHSENTMSLFGTATNRIVAAKTAFQRFSFCTTACSSTPKNKRRNKWHHFLPASSYWYLRQLSWCIYPILAMPIWTLPHWLQTNMPTVVPSLRHPC